MIGPPAHPARDDKAARSPTSVWQSDAPARERRPLASSPGGGRHRCAQRSERDGPRTVGWSVQQRVLQQGQWCRCGTSRQLAVRGSPASGGRCRPEVGVPSGPRDFARGGVLLSAQKTMAANSVRCRRARTVPVSAARHHAERRAGKGTPTSGQFSRWGPAPLRAAQRTGRTSNSGVVRTATGTSAGAVVQVRDIPPVGGTWFARLRRAVPTGGRRSKRSPRFCAWWRTAERAKNNGSELCSLPA